MLRGEILCLLKAKEFIHHICHVSLSIVLGYQWERIVEPNFTIENTCNNLHSGQTREACAVPATILQKKIETNVESFTLNEKRNAISENVSFLL